MIIIGHLLMKRPSHRWKSYQVKVSRAPSSGGRIEVQLSQLACVSHRAEKRFEEEGAGGWAVGECRLTRTITYIIIVPSSQHNLCCSYVTFIFLLFTSFLQVHCQYPPLCFSDPGVTSHRWSRYIRLSDWICTHLNWKFFVLEILRGYSSLPVRVYFFKTTQLLRNSWAITKGFRCQTFF